jgi:hypothetical protein
MKVSDDYKAIAKKLGINMEKSLTGDHYKMGNPIVGSWSLCLSPLYKSIRFRTIHTVILDGNENKTGAMCTRRGTDKKCGDCPFYESIFPYNGRVTKGLGLKLQ